jgi:hypothetical protein
MDSGGGGEGLHNWPANYSCKCVTVSRLQLYSRPNRTVYTEFFINKVLECRLLQLCSQLTNHPVQRRPAAAEQLRYGTAGAQSLGHKLKMLAIPYTECSKRALTARAGHRASQ